MTYEVVMETRTIGGCGRNQDQTKTVLCPLVTDGKSGIAFRDKDVLLAYAAARALNDGAVHLGGGPIDRFLYGRYAKQTLKKLGYLTST